jgi:hypothetical protein
VGSGVVPGVYYQKSSSGGGASPQAVTSQPAATLAVERVAEENERFLVVGAESSGVLSKVSIMVPVHPQG